MGRKKTRAFIRRGFEESHTLESGFFLSCGVLGSGIGAGRLVNAGCSLVFLAEFLDKTTSHKILQLFIGPEAQHFLATAHRIANLEIGENSLKKVIESKHLLFRKDVAEFVGDMVWKAT